MAFPSRGTNVIGSSLRLPPLGNEALAPVPPLCVPEAEEAPVFEALESGKLTVEPELMEGAGSWSAYISSSSEKRDSMDPEASRLGPEDEEEGKTVLEPLLLPGKVVRTPTASWRKAHRARPTIAESGDFIFPVVSCRSSSGAQNVDGRESREKLFSAVFC